MMRTCLIILFSVAAGLLVRSFIRRPAAGVVTDAVHFSAAEDPAVALRSLGATPHPSKLWNDDFAGFVTTHPGQWVVGHCAQPCLSESEAARGARLDAANSVWPIVEQQVPKRAGDSQRLRERVAADVVSGRLDVDHLAERFERPYGAVWTESVLLDVSPERIAPLVEKYKVEQSQWRQHQVRTRKAIAISILGVWFSYLLLNNLTRGYFTMRLRLAAALATAAGVALLI